MMTGFKPYTDVRHLRATPTLHKSTVAFMLLSWCCLAPFAFGTPTPTAGSPSATPVPTRHVVLISGINRDPDQLRDKAQAISRLHQFFSADRQDLTVLTAPESLVAHLGKTSSKDAITSTMATLASTSTPEDQVFIYFVGQANVVNEELRLNLPGPDLTGSEFAQAVAPIRAAQIVVVLDCPGAGLALKGFAGPNRILIAGARSDQPHSTSFSRYFIPALDDPESDYDRDGRTSLLEAFQTAAQQIDARYRDQRLLKSETPLLEDDNDSVPSQSPWRYTTSGKDGRLAARCYLRINDTPAPPLPPPESETETNNETGAGDHETIP